VEAGQRIVLASRPAGDPKVSDFRLEGFRPPAPELGEVFLKTKWLSLDPYMRGRMIDGPSYAKPVALGAVMIGGTVSEVVTSNADGFTPGDIVLGQTGWQTHAVAKSDALRKLNASIAPVTTALGILGMPGLTAYAGLTEIGKPKPGETVVVAAASGAVGSVVGQIAKILGARAIGIAGGAPKCRYAMDELGFDRCVDRRARDFAHQLKAACPDGIDVYFENAGGPIFECVFPLLNTFARVPVCGLMAQFNVAALAPGALQVTQLLRQCLTKRLTLRGFLVTDFEDKRAAFERDMSTWLQRGRLRYREDIVDGLANAPTAFVGMLRGDNFGKCLVRVG
jgi:NADPH-dependent curcumin reductase CurA